MIRNLFITSMILLCSGCMTVTRVSEGRSRYRKSPEFEGVFYANDSLDEQVEILESKVPRFPSYWRVYSRDAWARVEMIVDEEGVPTQIQTTKATDLFVAKAAERCVESWSFEPGVRGGKKVKSHLSVDLDFSSRMNRLRKLNNGKYKDTPVIITLQNYWEAY